MRKYNIDENYFEVIDTEEKAYWLGFLYADGCVSDNKYITIELSIKDKEQLEKFLKSTSANYPIKDKEKSNSCVLRIGSVKMVSDLIKHGCIPRKSLTLKYPNTVPSNLASHFIRGYFDGDGCISKSEKMKLRKDRNNKIYHQIIWTFKLVGTKEFLTSVVEVLDLPVNKITLEGSKAFQLKYGGSKKPLSVLDKIYNSATIYMDRKYEKYKQLQNQLNKPPQ